MTTHRFFVDEADVDCQSGIVTIVDPGQVKQITRVLRLGKGDLIEAIDGTGPVYECRIEEAGKQAVKANIVSTREAKAAPPFRLTVVLPLLKGGRFESCLAKLTEIGVDRIIPMASQRSVVKLSDQDRAVVPQWQPAGPKAKKSVDADDTISNRSSSTISKGSKSRESASQVDERMKRWMSIAKESTEQCERTRPPYMVHPTTLDEALNHLRLADNAGLTFICAERSQAPHLITILYSKRFGPAPDMVPPSDISIIIGPEGGFTHEEMEQAISLGCTPCSLGDNILRSETAAVVAAFTARSFGEFL